MHKPLKKMNFLGIPLELQGTGGGEMPLLRVDEWSKEWEISYDQGETWERTNAKAEGVGFDYFEFSHHFVDEDDGKLYAHFFVYKTDGTAFGLSIPVDKSIAGIGAAENGLLVTYTDGTTETVAFETTSKNVVTYTEQSLSGVQKARARENIGMDTTDTIPNRELTELWSELAELRGIVRDWPTLKGGQAGWYTSQNLRSITEVHFVKDYTPTGNEDDPWNADEGDAGSITGYQTGTVVTISANGSDKIRLNANSKGLFAYAEALTKITGLEMVDASNVATLNQAFYMCKKLKELDISCLHLPTLETMVAMCNSCESLETFKFSRYGTPSITECRVMFDNCPNLKYVDMGRGLLLVDKQMFNKCINLEKVFGLGDVTSIGDRAFIYASKVVDTDMKAKNITSIGESAFRLSGVEDISDLSTIPVDSVGDLATRHKRWSADALAAIEEVAMPDVYIDVPNTDNQSNYPDVQFGVRGGKPAYIAEKGCYVVSMYHAWNALHSGTDEEYSNFIDWWENKILESGWDITNVMDTTDDVEVMLRCLGWSRIEMAHVTAAEQLQKIVARLAEGYPVFGSMHSANVVDGKHAILIIGCNSKTRKLAILDPNVTGTTGTVSWVDFEDIFTEALNDYDYIDIIDFGE